MKDSRVRFFRLHGATWKPDFELLAHTEKLRAMTFSPDGRRLATGDDGGTVFVWDLEDTENRTKALRHLRHDAQQNVYGLAFLDEGNVLAASSPATRDTRGVTLWDLRPPTPVIVTSLAHPEKLRAIAAGEDGLYATSYAGEVVHWQRTSSGWSERPTALAGHAGLVFDVAVEGHRGLLATASEDGTVRLWEPRRPTFLRNLAATVRTIDVTSEGIEVITRAGDASFARHELGGRRTDGDAASGRRGEKSCRRPVRSR